MGELRHGSIETRRGRTEEASIGGSDDRTKLAIEAIIEVTKVAEQVSNRGIEASKRGIEKATKHPGLQARKGRKSNVVFERSKSKRGIEEATKHPGLQARKV
jgi:hypothetical protein